VRYVKDESVDLVYLDPASRSEARAEPKSTSSAWVGTCQDHALSHLRSRPRIVALRRRGLPCTVLGFVLLLAGCGGARRDAPLSEHSTQPYHAASLGDRKPLATGITCADGASSSMSGEPSYAAVVRHVAVAYAQPGGERLLGRFGRIDQNGYPTVVGVVGVRTDGDCKPMWYRVQLPVAPNGSTGWVAASAVRTYRVVSRIVVKLSTRRLVVYRSGRPVFRARVAIGTPQTPTPVGRYFVNERFLLSDPNGPFGVAALGISAHSDVLKDWIQGGPIALHGTGDPASIGSAASHGCIRLANNDMRRLFALAPAGTPVSILR
jgi:lipoprotein-anchoring transpeptidase ErfK/SrfK